MSVLQREVTSLQSKVTAIPKPEDLVLWSSLHEAMFIPGAAPQLLGDSDLWQISELASETTVAQTASDHGGGGLSHFSEAIQHPRFLETIWQYQSLGLGLGLGLRWDPGLRLDLGLDLCSDPGLLLGLGFHLKLGLHPNLGLSSDPGLLLGLGLRLDPGLHLDLGLGLRLDLGLHLDMGLHPNLGLRSDLGLPLNWNLPRAFNPHHQDPGLYHRKAGLLPEAFPGPALGLSGASSLA
ncbi:hypothetical protein Celaphus_00006878 [Cervus elaphus hippelaphus]|uniref:Uncharacterized protein n=1 Tax=Cervus elaphus hippelaphus TaxID=46360 RepID=A0A212CZF8_CEREH|nr:hypothetical protein Celaphus_00006878 [Cervus elaphus hippelaphus]